MRHSLARLWEMKFYHETCRISESRLFWRAAAGLKNRGF